MVNRLKVMVTLAICIISLSVNAQKKVLLEVEPSPTIVETNKPLQLKIIAKDEEGNVLEETENKFWPIQIKGVEQNIYFANSFDVDSTGKVTASIPGEYDLMIYRMPAEGEAFTQLMHKVKVVNQPVAKIETIEVPSSLYEGAISAFNLKILDKAGIEVDDKAVTMSSSNEKILQTDNLYNVYALSPGKATVTITVGEIKTTVDIEVKENPVRTLDLTVNYESARTGDVLQFSTRALDKSGKVVADAPAIFSVQGTADEAGAGASAQIDRNGRFVAEKPGTYMITVSSGKQTASKAVRVGNRDVERQVNMIGHGTVNDKHSSDLWIWEANDGRDYAVTGTWGSDGKAYFWDVTEPGNIVLVDSVQVDARTVNDVKVSEDGTICVLSREGASNRKNGIVIVDVKDPNNVSVITEYTDQLTGGVHNVFIYKDHVYALSNGQRYEIINIEDPAKPVRVGKFELENSGRSIHDVWIEDGIAYSSNWGDGVVMVDVGNGIAGGTPANPVEISRSPMEGGANHAAFPYKSKDTGKFYVLTGDEIFPIAFMSGKDTEIFIPSGYIHFMDFTDLDNPVEVARYEVPEAGSHNMWIEDDLLYIGYYNGGLRVVDISGDLMGDLYKQGREVANFTPYTEEAYVPNAPFVWGAQPHKGYIFFTDFNSGLWSAQIEPVRPENTSIDTNK